MPGIVLFGYSDVGYVCLDLLLAQKRDVRLVVTHEDDPSEAKWFRSVAQRARAAGVETLTAEIKDGPAIKGDQANRQVPAGEGVMDFGSIAKAGGTSTEWMIVEFDEYEKDIFDGIQRSYTYLTSKGYATGKV